MGLSMFTFSINDNSFLTNTSQMSSNIFGNIGSYLASFIYYSFGLFGYGEYICFISFSILPFMKETILLFHKIINFFNRFSIYSANSILLIFVLLWIEQIDTWGIFSKQLFLLHQNNSFSCLYLLLENIFFICSKHLLMKFPKLKLIRHPLFKNN